MAADLYGVRNRFNVHNGENHLIRYEIILLQIVIQTETSHLIFSQILNHALGERRHQLRFLRCKIFLGLAI